MPDPDTIAGKALTSASGAFSGLARLNTHLIGNAGLSSAVGGGSAIIFALNHFFFTLKHGSFVLTLYHERQAHESGHASAQLVGLFAEIIGAVVITVVGATFAYFGRPKTIAT